MLGNCEKMVVISSTNNEWPQIDEKSLMGMEKQNGGQEQHQQQQPPPPQQPPLKCPRCDSSNTKFCYYNNYSLSQPRHFCKACKRYWTRGGTLRNVPVGGGCRKNKRVKRPNSANSNSSSIDGGSAASSNPSSNPNNNLPHQIDISSTSNLHHHQFNPLFYGLHTTTNIPSSSDMSNNPLFNSRYDLQPQLNALGLGFSSGMIMNNNDHHGTDDGTHNYRNGFHKQIQDLSSYSNFGGGGGGGGSLTSSTPTMASLLASSFHQQKYMNGIGGVKNSSTTTTTAQTVPNINNHFNVFDGLQMTTNGEARLSSMKEVKAEDHHQNRMDNWNIQCQNQLEQIGLSSSPTDPSLFWNNNNATGANWHDPTNVGSSVTSLI